jgi:hypothetical protein
MGEFWKRRRDLTLAVVWALSVSVVSACTCKAPGVREAKALADVVFRGKIIALRDSTEPSLSRADTHKIAVFRVTRVWKGEVEPAFQMPAYEETSACWGFWPRLLKVGNELLVYAKRLDGGTPGAFIFITSICSRTALIENDKDLEKLGDGYEPGKSPASIRRRIFVVSVAVILVLASLMAYIFQRRFSARAGSWASIVP